MKRLSIVLFIALAFDAGTVYAQQQNEGTAYLAVPGIVYQDATFGDDNPRSSSGWGPTIGVQIRAPQTGLTAFAFESTAQLNALENPHACCNSRFGQLFTLFGVQIGRGVYVRPSGGIAVQGGGVAPALGVAIGRDKRFGDSLLTGVEFVVRIAGSPGLAGWTAGLQVPIGACR